MKTKIKKITTELLTKTGIKPISIEIKKDENDTYCVNLELLEETIGLFVGKHGNTISSFQLILKLLLFKENNVWPNLIIDVGGYRNEKKQSLETMAENTVKQVQSSGEPIALFHLNPFERRIIHMYLKNNDCVETISQGEGKNRHLIIQPTDKIEKPPLPDENQEPIIKVNE